MGVIGVDGGNTKTELLVLDDGGEPVAYVRGAGSNSHGLGADGCVDVIAGLVERAGVDGPADHGAFYLCGADVPADIAALTDAVAARGWARSLIVDNDTFALLRTGTDARDAVAVVCGAGINCVGRSADGRIARYPALGWETGDWGGSDMLGRDVLFHAARAEDGRGEPTALVQVVRAHFATESVAALGEDLHYGRVRQQRLGELAPAVVTAAEEGDAIARRLVERLAEEVVLLVEKALGDLGLLSTGDCPPRGQSPERPADVVLGGGMLRQGRGLLHDEVVTRLRDRAPAARPVVATDPPVLGAALAALDAAGASAGAGETLRSAFRSGLEPVAA
jgi:N-acetylglucosamine kinase-like BadF-type ATPase